MTIERLKELKRDLDDLAMSHSHTDEFDSYDFYDSMPQTFADLERLIDDEIERQSVKDEETEREKAEFMHLGKRVDEINGLEVDLKSGTIIKWELTPREKWAYKEAKRYHELIEHDRFIYDRPKEPCEWCSRFSIMATQDNTAVYPPTREKVVFNYCPSCGREL